LAALSAQGAAPAGAAEPYGRELRVAMDLARQAGRLVTEMRPRVRPETKDHGEVVTAADRAASVLIVEALTRAFPNDLVISEESKQNWGRIRFARRVWFVDPIDGTQSYVEPGRNGFAVQIGLVERKGFFDGGRPVLGVVYQPALNRLYYASPAVGARLRDASGDHALVPSTRTHPQALRLIASPSTRSSDLAALKAAVGITGEVRMGSVGVKLGHIANGEADINLRPANSSTRPWDIAAPDAILTLAGGRFTTLAGKAFPYNRIHIPGGMLATNGAAHAAVLERLGGLARPSLTARLRSFRKNVRATIEGMTWRATHQR
jgi:3'(2'), 5'-bisphosphate nucleotidase